jgi:oxygen-independent coproporphyrinogen-3 oxidase
VASLYLHIPFCEHKCIYCDFYSIAPSETEQEYDALVGRFLKALDLEIGLRGQDPIFQSTYETIFFGGGTPSLLSPSSVGSILNKLAGKFPIDDNIEISLETNPGTVSLEKLREFKSVGVNRISFGIQSFHEKDLRFLTRIHSADQAKDNVRNAFKAGFDNVSFDLIFALPGQTLEEWNLNLTQALELTPKHISCYSLIVEPNTPLNRMVEAKQVVPLSAEVDASMYERTIEVLSEAGYAQYEISNFALPGFKCRHNSNYWNHVPYLSFGPSAHSFWNGKRWWNQSNVTGYADALERGVFPVAGEEVLSRQQWLDETIYLGLRSEGIHLPAFKERFNLDLLEQFKALVDGLLTDHLANVDNDRLMLTRKGYLLCDEICRSFR